MEDPSSGEICGWPAGRSQENNMTYWKSLILMTAALMVGGFGCAEGTSKEDLLAQKTDSGWIGADSYEVGGIVRGVVQHPGTGSFDGLAFDENLQAQLVDKQIKFIKVTAERKGWRFNQLADSVNILGITTDDNGVTIEYEAVVDLLGRFTGRLPSLNDIDPRLFDATVPMVPTGFSLVEMQSCAATDGSHSIKDMNFHYYFAPDRESCQIEKTSVMVEITEVFDRPLTYPEYDRLLQTQDDDTLGFYAALVPNRGDDDPLGRFQSHADMLEQDLGLTGEDMEGGEYRRYIWRDGDVKMVLDLYNPAELPWMGSFASSFRDKLKTYTLVHYNGHSSYGTKHLLDDPDAFSDAYQIIMMHSCQSYAYYTRQVFRAKATSFDPSGFDLADIIATGKSSYPSGAPKTLRVLLSALMKGMTSIQRNRPADAPDWITIAEDMKGATYGDILYGVAGVRTNRWLP
jgi:hypothetical protein